MPQRLRIPVRALRVGDILVPTNREVCGYGASRGVRTPPRHHDVDLRPAEYSGDPEGHGYTRSTFRSDTIVTVLRNA